MHKVYYFTILTAIGTVLGSLVAFILYLTGIFASFGASTVLAVLAGAIIGALCIWLVEDV